MELVKGDLKWNSSWKIGMVTSRFNQRVTSKLEVGALSQLKERGATDNQIVRVQVPGAVEIPMAAQWLFENGCDAVVALGAVIRGETSHFDYVCSSVERGCTELQLKYNKPLAFGVLTTENSEQAFARIGGAKGHKGVESVEVIIEMLNLKEYLNPKGVR